MTGSKTRACLLVLAALAALAFAASPASAHGGRKAVGVSRQTLVKAAAAYIGVTPAELLAAKRAGQTPGGLAVAKGMTAQGLRDAHVAAGTKAIDDALAAGRITSAQAQAKLAALPARVDAFINSSGGGGSGCGSDSGSASSGSASALHRGRG
jgi:hypothetical protein